MLYHEIYCLMSDIYTLRHKLKMENEDALNEQSCNDEIVKQNKPK